MYNFADAAEERVRGQRRNRGELKKEAREVLDVVRGLASMSAKQLGAVAHLLPPGAVDAIGIAARLPRSNKGRRRQEALVAKLLRAQLTEPLLERLGDAVELAVEYDTTYEDADVSAMVDAWREGLLADAPEVVAEVNGLPTAWGLDTDLLRNLVKQCQAALEEEREAEPADRTAEGGAAAANATGPGGGEPDSGGGSVDEDEEDLTAVLAEAAARSGAPGAARRRQRAKSAAPRSRALLRRLMRTLRPLALRVCEERLWTA